MFNVKIMSKIRRLLEFLKSYENCFNHKNAKTFFEHKNEHHVINLISDAESLYESFNILFKFELDILRNDLLKNLILNYV